MLASVILNINQLHDKVAQILEKTKGSFMIKGSWVAQYDITNFSKYHKGSEGRKRFDIFGETGLFNSDFDEWKHQRKLARAFINHQKFQQLMAKIVPEMIERGLIPVLDHVSEEKMLVDFQDLLKRTTFDFACLIATGHNPNSLSVGFSDAVDDACEAILIRHLVPESLWKLQSWLGFGKEKKLANAWRTIDQFWEKQKSMKQEEIEKGMEAKEDEGIYSLLNCYLSGHEVTGPTPAEKVMRDNITGLIFATEGTTSIALTWFFWLVSKNPFAETKIREELKRNFSQEGFNKPPLVRLNELNKLVYLHAALCETLRLYPPVPFEIRIPLQPDVLPSGHQVNQNTHVLISAYSMARMTSVWGEDCREFKPERWITEDGRIRHEPPHKFFSFNAGPRICIGKDIAFTLMKATAASIIHNYDVQVVKNHPVTYNLSIGFRMKHGLLARVSKGSAQPRHIN
ncbi:cytochrome P450 family 96 subfamily A polypeptide 1 [Citrus sinensis]|uniref:Cytochrome P450 family 96 subfamily A polypeptide 1 n=1 Tax=Citrus sinensis TaxID=2711 RepID=A0ACB8JL86_CITSI|nr:cytochrome P450 family 96 subfamily A polypeptide 1 [Citrus sinensis]